MTLALILDDSLAEKHVRAETVVDAWCRRYEHSRADIPRLIEHGSPYTVAGRLVYALRKYIDLDPISCGTFLNVHPSYVSRLQGKMRDAIEVKQNVVVKHPTEEFLADCGFIERSSVTASSPLERPYEPGTARMITILHREAEPYIKKVVGIVKNVGYEDVFRQGKVHSHTVARCIAYAVLYHIVLGSRGQQAISVFCKTKERTVYENVRRLHKVLASEERSDFKAKILEVCAAIGVSPDALLPT